jgi:hypothetical protein
MTKQAAVVVLPVSAGRLSDSSSEAGVEAPEAQRLERAVARIRADAREQAPRYRDDTVVPEGGE